MIAGGRGRGPSRLQDPLLKRNIPVEKATFLLYSKMVISSEFKRWLEQQGCSFSPAKGSHLKLIFYTLRGKVSVTY
jgi:hypothetical protein